MSAEEAVSVASVTDGQERRAIYNKMVRETRLISISLQSVQFKVSGAMPPQAERSFVFKRQITDFAYVKEDNAIICGAEWTVEIRSKRKKIARCVVLYHVFYDSFSPVPDDIAELYAENQALATTYSYFRALYANLDWSAGFNSPPLPIVKFMPKV